MSVELQSLCLTTVLKTSLIAHNSVNQWGVLVTDVQPYGFAFPKTAFPVIISLTKENSRREVQRLQDILPVHVIGQSEDQTQDFLSVFF